MGESTFDDPSEMPEQCLTCSCMLGPDSRDDEQYACRPESLVLIFSEDDPELIDRVAELVDQASEFGCPEHTTEVRQDRYVPFHGYDVDLEEDEDEDLDFEEED
jgi:hypothetical protein